MVELGKALTELDDPASQIAGGITTRIPQRFVPITTRVVQGLKRDDLFTVVHEQFLTDTTDYADIVLPATTFLEHKDLVASYGHYYLQVSHQAHAAPRRVQIECEFFRALALRMGFEDECFRDPVDQMIDCGTGRRSPQLAGITRERLEKDPHVRLNLDGADGFWLPFANGFFTANGKAVCGIPI